MSKTYETREEVEKLSEKDPQLYGLLTRAQFTALNMADFVANQPPIPTLLDTANEYNFTIPMRDGHLSTARVFLPSTPATNTPLIVLLFGGGWVAGNYLQALAEARTFRDVFNVAAITISYRLAPEHTFPVAHHDAWDNVHWLSQHAGEKFGIDLNAGFIIGGTSAGGNLTANVVQKAVHEGLTPKITGALLLQPWVLEPEIVPEKYKELFIARVQNADQITFSEECAQYVRDKYQFDVKSPEFSPFNTQNPHKGFPKTFIEVCGADLLRDDGLVYEKVLRENGVETKLSVIPGVPHVHQTFSAFGEQLDCVDKTRIAEAEGVAWLLGKEAPDSKELLKKWVANATP
ncbi:alpha/beta-hydrolase [Ascodesmis nigricans]|uniref:Alpha/beta-hydrolase n=1 Tax=Ascodesmis nigricans TaxID=341454 RepID=A0A4S2MV48_9PEZI|nr:alpha/beta-hydrolase [Ascodesmis nigricans]